MRILHTSDLHLGRSFFGFDILDAQAACVDHLVSCAASQQADLVIVAGDVYDRAIPAPAAVTLFDRLLSGLRACNIPVLATSGNHDSFLRLGFGSELLDTAGIHLRTRLRDIERPVLFTREGAPTSDDAQAATAVYGIPYLEPALVAHRFGVARTHAAVLGHAIERVRTHHGAHHPDASLVVAAHAFVAGGRGSDSERAIDVGGVGVVPVEAFSDVDYGALGHLHRPQAPATTVRYPGSPVPYSFDEGQKQHVLVTVEEPGSVTVEEIPMPEFLPVRTVTGTLDDVVARAVSPDLADALVQVRLTDPQRIPQALSRLKTAYPRLVRFEWTVQAPATPAERSAAGPQRGDEELFADFVGEVTGTAATATQRSLFATALNAATREDA